MAELLPPEQDGIEWRGTVGEDAALRGGDTGANTMERNATGRFMVFHISEALDATDTNGVHDVYARDLLTGTCELLSKNSAGTAAGNGMSTYGLLSSDNRYVVFASQASNLVAGDTNGTWDVFKRDRQTNTTTLVSVNTAGVLGNGSSTWPCMSSDGRYVAFTSTAKNLGGSPTTQSIYLRDTTGNTTTPIFVGNGACFQPALSGDGRYVACSSQATNLVNGFTANGKLQIFWVDRNVAGSAELVSKSSAGTMGTAESYMPSLSDDGQVISFESNSSNLVAGDTNGFRDIFVRNRTTSTTTRESLASDGATQANSHCYQSSITRDGTKVLFSSDSNNLVAGDTNGVRDTFCRTVGGAALTRLSQTSGGTAGDGASDQPSWSADGTLGFYRSASTNIDWTDQDSGARDIYGWNPDTAVSNTISRVEAVSTGRVSLDSAQAQVNGASSNPAISHTGRFVAFDSVATNLVAGDTNGVADVFVKDQNNHATQRVSVATAGTQADGASTFPGMTADGRYVVFASVATNLVAGDTDATSDIYMRDLTANTTTLLSVSSASVKGNGASLYPRISASGRYVVFESDATNLVASDTNAQRDIFLRDLTAGTTERVNLVHSTNAQSSGGGCYLASVSDNGRYVAFESDAPLTSVGISGKRQIYLRDRNVGGTASTSLVTGDNSNTSKGANSACNNARVSNDGRYVAFDTNSNNMNATGGGSRKDVFLRDMQQATGGNQSPYTAIRICSLSNSGALGDGNSSFAGMSSDGQVIAFESTSTNLVTPAATSTQVYAHDMVSGMTYLISKTTDGTTYGNGVSGRVAISGNGVWAALHSAATNLVTGDTNGVQDVFVRQTLFR